MQITSIRQDRVVGFYDEQEMILDHIMKENKNSVDVISIVGMPGLGKTTLAQLVFQNVKVCNKFPIRIWVSVSQSNSRREIFLRILRHSTTLKATDTVSDMELGSMVREYLEGKKFFLVLDDVWDIGVWDSLKDVLASSHNESKVLITSRLMEVGRRAGYVHMLRFLNVEESWQLLQKEVFGERGQCPPELKHVGEKIVEQCRGLPMMIVTMGSVLRNKYTISKSLIRVVSEWQVVAENMSRYLHRDNPMIDVLGMCYDSLADNVKECFLYLAVFPEDHEIPVWTLIRLWIAEGLVFPNGSMELEDIALEYLDDLVNNSLLISSDVKMCRVHGLIHEFCKSKALEQNLYQEIKFSNGVFQPPISEIKEARRLSLNSESVEVFLQEEPMAPLARTFLSLRKSHVRFEPKNTSSIPQHLKLLRILEFESIMLQKFPAWISKLVHLRYLTLFIAFLPMIPQTISGIRNLQTFVVETSECSTNITMGANIWKMTQLRHVKTNATLVLDPEWKCRQGAGDKLQSITFISPESCTPSFGKNARYLRKLGIRGKLAEFLENMSMEHLSKLQKLKLVNDDAPEVRPHHFPQLTCFPQDLRKLTLENTLLEWKHMSILALLETLEVLKLKNNAFAGDHWSAADCEKAFPRLRSLFIETSDLSTWEASSYHFPLLASLVLRNCQHLAEIPESVVNNLQKLQVSGVSESVARIADEISKKN